MKTYTILEVCKILRTHDDLISVMEFFNQELENDIKHDELEVERLNRTLEALELR